MKSSLYAILFFVVVDQMHCFYGNSRQTSRRTDKSRNIGRNCEKLIGKESCDFYSQCVKPDVTSCQLRDDLEGVCRQTKRGEKKLNAAGKEYIRNVRNCFQRRLLSPNDVISCSPDDMAPVLAPPDIKSDCLFQNVSLCSVLSNRKNARGLADIVSSLQPGEFTQRFISHFNSLSQNCNQRAKENLDRFLPERLLNELISTTKETSPSTSTSRFNTNVQTRTTPNSVPKSTTPAAPPTRGSSSNRQGRNCEKLIGEESCDFYSQCVKPDMTSCQLRDDLEGVCRQTKRGERKLNAPGKKYVRNVRRCFQRRLLSPNDVISCSPDDMAPVLAPSDIKSDCLFQNVSLCSVLSNRKNARGLADIVSSLQSGEFTQRFISHFNSLSQNCNQRAKENFDRFLPERLLNELISTTKETSPSTSTSRFNTNVQTRTTPNSVPKSTTPAAPPPRGSSSNRQGRNCEKLIGKESCDFYSQCVKPDMTSCQLRDDLEGVCRQTKRGEKKLNAAGKKYVRNVRNCFQRRLLSPNDVISCSPDDMAPVLAPSDIKSDCLFQNVSLCSVLSNSKNARGLADIISSLQSGEFTQRFISHFNSLSQNCNQRAKENFDRFLPERLLNELISTTKETSPSTSTSRFSTNVQTRTTSNPVPRTTTPAAPTTRGSSSNRQESFTEKRCQQLGQITSCDFYSACVMPSESTCRLRDDMEDFCRKSAAAKFDSRGDRYLQNVRVCLQKNLLTFADVTSCAADQDDLDRIFAPTDIKSDCIYQNVSLCSILTVTTNVQALLDVFSSVRSGYFIQKFAGHLDTLVQACSNRARESYRGIFPEDLTDIWNPVATGDYSLLSTRSRQSVLLKKNNVRSETNPSFYADFEATVMMVGGNGD